MVLDASLLNTQHYKARIKGNIYIYIYIVGIFYFTKTEIIYDKVQYYE